MRLSKCPPERQLEYKNTYSDREAGPAAAIGGADDLARPRQRDVPGGRAGRMQPGGDEVDGAAAREAVLAPLPLEELDALRGARRRLALAPARKHAADARLDARPPLFGAELGGGARELRRGEGDERVQSPLLAVRLVHVVERGEDWPLLARVGADAAAREAVAAPPRRLVDEDELAVRA